jgi:hypothetical protein
MLASVCSFCEVLWNELIHANIRFLPVDSGQIFLSDSAGQRAIGAYFTFLAVTIVSAYVLSRQQIAKGGLWLLEAVSWVLVGLACLMPTKVTRFFYGVIFFGTGICIHSRIIARAVNATGVTSGPRKEWWNILYFNLVDRVGCSTTVRIADLSKVWDLIFSLLLSDACIYLVREWIPDKNNVSAGNQDSLQAVAGAMWVLFVLDVFYVVGTCQLDLLGAPLPTELWHVHPLLSESLSEFWGVRWNPVVGKLLQDGFYKPLKGIGARRWVCIVASFVGSAVLHTVPTYIALRSPRDIGMVAAFFLLQGLAVLAEVAAKRLYRLIVGCGSPAGESAIAVAKQAKQLDVDLAVESSSLHVSQQQIQADRHSARQAEARACATIAKSAPFQGVAEVLLILFILSASYCVAEFRHGLPLHLTSQQRDAWVAVSVALGVGTLSFYYVVRSYIYTAKQDLSTRSKSTGHVGQHLRWRFEHLPMRVFALSLVSWMWGVVVMMCLLPLYATPMLHITEESHAQSVLVGPLIRAVAQCLWK